MWITLHTILSRWTSAFFALAFCQVGWAATRNRLDARIFRNRPDLYFSEVRIASNPHAPVYLVENVFDKRAEHFGELVYDDLKVDGYPDFWKTSVEREIRLWFGKYLDSSRGISKRTGIDTIHLGLEIEQLFPAAVGFGWSRAFGKVRIKFENSRYDELPVSFVCEDLYVSYGLDREWEGSLFQTVEQAANIALGISLKHCANQFILNATPGII